MELTVHCEREKTLKNQLKTDAIIRTGCLLKQNIENQPKYLTYHSFGFYNPTKKPQNNFFF